MQRVARWIFVVLAAVTASMPFIATDSAFSVSANSSSPTTTRASGLIPAPKHLSVRLVLASKHMIAGTMIRGTLVVTNRSGQSINLNTFSPDGCEPQFAVVLSNENIPPLFGFTQECSAAPLIVAPGTNRFPFTLMSFYLACANAGPTPGIPHCLPTGRSPPLPPGKYHAVLIGDELALPPAIPPPVTVSPAQHP